LREERRSGKICYIIGRKEKNPLKEIKGVGHTFSIRIGGWKEEENDDEVIRHNSEEGREK